MKISKIVELNIEMLKRKIRNKVSNSFDDFNVEDGYELHMWSQTVGSDVEEELEELKKLIGEDETNDFLEEVVSEIVEDFEENQDDEEE